MEFQCKYNSHKELFLYITFDNSLQDSSEILLFDKFIIFKF